MIFAAQPLFAPLRPLLDCLPGDGEAPDMDMLNELAAGRGIVTASGAPLRFVAPGGSRMSYEERTWWLGEVETRPGNWHDCFNALVWLGFPQTKMALNACHHRALARQRSTSHAERNGRGPLRDALTQFDECGAIVVSSNLELWQGIRMHRWQDVFWTRRAEVQHCMKVFVFGHASLDLLRNPHIGLCAKSVFLHVDEEWLAQSAAAQLADVDARIAGRFSGDLHSYAHPRNFHPLPLLGIPGATPDNESSAYYENTRQFRPRRIVSGSFDDINDIDAIGV